jgi:hypothetical protein
MDAKKTRLIIQRTDGSKTIAHPDNLHRGLQSEPTARYRQELLDQMSKFCQDNRQTRRVFPERTFCRAFNTRALLHMQATRRSFIARLQEISSLHMSSIRPTARCRFRIEACRQKVCQKATCTHWPSRICGPKVEM